MSQRKVFAATLLALGLLGSSAAYGEEAGTTVDSLTATVGTTSIAVSGEATFSGAPVVEVATDPAGDHETSEAPAPTGNDLVSASIQALDASTVQFQITLANLPEGGMDEVMNYNWPILVTKGGSTTEVTLGAHSAATGREIICSTGLFVCTGSTDNIGQPVFDVQTCTPNETTGGNDCASQSVPGELTADSFIWRVPASQIGASGGDATIVGNGDITASRSASGVTWWTDGSAGDTMAWGADEFAYPAPTVSLGVASADTPDDAVTFTNTVTARSNGTFTATVPTPATSGPYKLVAEACFGPDNCGLGSTTFTIA